MESSYTSQLSLRQWQVPVYLLEEFESISLCKFDLGDAGPTPGRKFKVLMFYSQACKLRSVCFGWHACPSHIALKLAFAFRHIHARITDLSSYFLQMSSTLPLCYSAVTQQIHISKVCHYPDRGFGNHTSSVMELYPQGILILTWFILVHHINNYI